MHLGIFRIRRITYGTLKRKVGRHEGCVGKIDNRFVNFQGDGMCVCVLNLGNKGNTWVCLCVLKLGMKEK
jgi:hypothetical protein